MTDKPFWETTSLADMTAEQWESLCDGCGKCCLLKLEDEDTLELAYTNVACRQLDLGTCQCKNYAKRSLLVPDCVTMTAANITEFGWMPKTCAYRRLAEGKTLAWWHPLISGDPETVHTAGMSVRGRSISERVAGDLEDHITDWPEEDIP
ncbi:YcgN family cysteine cluster protein [Sneathiella chinensis]|uniref:YcgN family cysteine cluster protein n=1 Tax=Sneathiella chinensis TaxID=349750 RepID=UPI00146BA8F7|nr:YcgN family cysteine cluster protein [Sneathiella chinensis]